MRIAHFAIHVIALLLYNPMSFANEGKESKTRIGIEKALNYLSMSGEKWKNKRGCVSCHQIPPMLWAFRIAEQSDYQIDYVDLNLKSWSDWSTNVTNFVKPEQKPDCDEAETMSANIDTMAGLLLALPETNGAGIQKRFLEHLVREQQDDGSWNPCGQLPAQRRTPQETRLATTLWVTHAMGAELTNDQKDAVGKRFSEFKNVESTEVLALQLINSHIPLDLETETVLETMLADQNDDGGWGWLRGESSDALGTGIALYALSQQPWIDNTKISESIVKARQFLTATQQPDGKWIVPGTKKTAKGNPTQTANDWGTAWAVIGLLETTVQ